MKVVVLGASGNAGTALLRALEAEPASRRSSRSRGDRPTAGTPRRRPGARLDVVADPLEPVLAGADAVVHLAWLIQPSRDRAQTHAVNVGGSRRVMRGGGRGGRPRARLRLVGRRVLARPQGPPGRRDVADGRRALVVLLARQGRGRAAARCLRARAARRPRRAPAPGPHLPARRGVGDPAPVRRARSCPAGSWTRSGSRSCRAIRGCASRPSTPTTSPTPTGAPSSATPAAPSTSPPSRSSTARRSGACSTRVRSRARAASCAAARPAPSTCASPRRRRAGSTWRSPSRSWTRTRAREVLGWQPTRDAGDTLLELLDGMRTEAGAPTPTLVPGGDGRLRSREILSGIGARGPR